MLVLVCGSRDFPAPSAIRERLAKLDPGTQVIHGGADGADSMADEVARELGFEVTIVPALWAVHGRRAGMIRNVEMLERNPDLVLAFWDGWSPGTSHTISEARRRRIPVEVIER